MSIRLCSGRLHKLPGEPEPSPDEWDLVIRANTYVHPTAPGKRFRKRTVLVRDRDGYPALGYALVTYFVATDPQDVAPAPHKSSKDQLVRTLLTGRTELKMSPNV